MANNDGYSQHKLIDFVISNASAKGIRKNSLFFSTHTYIKFWISPGDNLPILPHHEQCFRSRVAENNADPDWNGQEFFFLALSSDTLEVEIRDKYTKTLPMGFSRVIEHRKLLLSTLLNRHAKHGQKQNVDLSLYLCETLGDMPPGNLHFEISFLLTSQMNRQLYFNTACGLICPVDETSNQSETPEALRISSSKRFFTTGSFHKYLNSDEHSEQQGQKYFRVCKKISNYWSAYKRNTEDQSTSFVDPKHTPKFIGRSEATASTTVPSSLSTNQSVVSSDANAVSDLQLKSIKLNNDARSNQSSSIRSVKRTKNVGQPVHKIHSRFHMFKSMENIPSLFLTTENCWPRKLNRVNHTFDGKLSRQYSFFEPHVDLECKTNSHLYNSLRGFSYFGSIDSLHMTAPLATPEKDASLVGNNAVLCSGGGVREQHSLDGITNDVFEDHQTTNTISSINEVNVTKNSQNLHDQQQVDVDQNLLHDNFYVSYPLCDTEEVGASATVSFLNPPPASSNCSLNFSSVSNNSAIVTVPEPSNPIDDDEFDEDDDLISIASSGGDNNDSVFNSPHGQSKLDFSVLDPTSANLSNEVFVEDDNEIPPVTSSQVSSSGATRDSSSSVLSDSAVSSTIMHMPHIPHRSTYRMDVTEQLPMFWESRIDSHGRIFYIDHENHTTTWHKPSMVESGSNASSRQQSDSIHRRSLLENRYKSIQKTLVLCSKNRLSQNSRKFSRCSFLHELENTMNIPTHRRNSALPSCSPVVKFLSRPDFLSLVAQSDNPGALLYNRSSVRHMVTRIQKDFSIFSRYQHNRDLVTFLNSFADRQKPLPENWDSKFDKNGKIFFINHAAKSTTFIDPRLPCDPPPLQNPLLRLQKPSCEELEEENITNIEPRSNLLSPCESRQRSHSVGENEMVNSSPDFSHASSPPSPRLSNQSSFDGQLQQQLLLVPGSGHSLYSSPDLSSTSSMSRQSSPNPCSEASQPEYQDVSYNEKVVAFLRQPNIMSILSERRGRLAKNKRLRDKVNAVRVDGQLMLDRLKHDMEFILLLSLFENEIMCCHVGPNLYQESLSPTPSGGRGTTLRTSPGSSRSNSMSRSTKSSPQKRDFEAKLRYFYRKLEAKGYGQGPGKLKLLVRRDRILEDAFSQIMATSKRDLSKLKLCVSFCGEEGLDYGGPSREFFFLLSRQVFNPYYGLFEYSANDTYTVQISPISAFVDHHQNWFRLCGRLLGLALVHKYLLDVFFTRPFYKALLKLPVSLSDLESLDAEFHQSLQWLKDNEVTDPEQLGMTFCVNEEVFGKVVERELKTGGTNILVNEKNKKDYINRIVRWRLDRGVVNQTEFLVKGFYEIVDSRFLSAFDASELELLIAGTAEIDINDWRRNSEYRSGYHDSHPVIVWFWGVIEKFDNDHRLRLLQFVTGTSSIPYEGFSSLRGSNGPRKFCIEKWGKQTSLPRAHTCFNRLDLPPYSTPELLLEKLMLAVEESSTFGIE